MEGLFDPPLCPTLSDLARRFAGRKVAVVGDAILDCYRQIGPGWPQRSRCFAGGAAVIAAHLNALGAEAVLITALGKDDGDSRRLRSLLRGHGVSLLEVASRESVPTRVRRVSEADGQLTITRVPGPELVESLPAETIGRVAGTVAELRTSIDGVIFVDFGYGIVQPAMLDALLPTLRPSVGFLAGDVSGPRASLLAMRGFDLLTPTEAELRRLTPIPSPRPPLQRIARRMVDELALAHLLTTRDRQGCLHTDAHGQTTDHPTLADRVIDTVGAGDALLATTSLAMIAGLPATVAIHLGQRAAAAVVSRLGNEPIRLTDLTSDAGAAVAGIGSAA